MSGGANPHQRRVVERRPTAIAAVYRQRIEVPGQIAAACQHDQAKRNNNGRRRVKAFHPVRTNPLVRQTGGPPRTAAVVHHATPIMRWAGNAVDVALIFTEKTNTWIVASAFYCRFTCNFPANRPYPGHPM